ncbi:MAG TPA: cupin domain-containing protein [Dehalococcoidia bacterium]|nr:cupin domain-containing protein [Dehalococcoidia bacterium]
MYLRRNGHHLRRIAWQTVATRARFHLVLGMAVLCVSTIAVFSARSVRGQTGPHVVHEDTFKATGLPAGDVNGLARHTMWPAGFSLKHVHGGPAYVYVIAGSIDITDANMTMTYNAGDFFWEPGGHIHTATAGPEGVEFFVLFLLPEGADATIPVQ